MKRASCFWLCGLLSASCVVNGFTIEDQLPGAGGSTAGDAGSGVGGTPSGAGTSSQGGGGASGAAPQGGKAGNAGSQGEGGVPASGVAPCDQNANGLPPLLCDDFESGGFDQTKWSPPAGLGVTTQQGPRGVTKLAYLNGGPLATKLGDFPISEAGGEVTVSFWLKVVSAQGGSPIVSFRDRTAVQGTVRLSLVVGELGWRSTGSNFMVPQSPTGAMLTVDEWTCVSIHLTARTMVLSYQMLGASSVTTLTVDDVSTAGVDANWQTLPVEARYGAGYPEFAGILAGVPTDMYLDDVRITADSSSVCVF